MWFSQNLAKIEKSEINDMNEEREALEVILEFIEKKKAEKNKKIADVEGITEQTFKQSKTVLKKDIKEMLDFLKSLRARLGEHMKEDELAEVLGMWKQLDKSLNAKESRLVDLKAEFKKLYSLMINDLNKLAGFVIERHKRILEFLKETEHPAAPPVQEEKEEAEELPKEEIPDDLKEIEDLSKDTEIPEDDSEDDKDVL